MSSPRLARREALAVLFGLGLAACSRASSKDKPTRVISVSPSTTETMFAIGAGDLLVGRSRDCDYPKEAEKLPIVGGFADPNLEAILALSPSLVIGARGPAGPVLEESLRSHGVDTFFPETESVETIVSMILEVGRRVGREEGAKSVAVGVQTKQKKLAEAVVGKPRVKVLFLFDVAPIFVAGPGSFPDELVRLAGGENVITRGGAYPTVGLEHLLALAPDVLLDGASDAHATEPLLKKLAVAPGFKDLTAVREGRVRPVGSDALRPGPRIGDGLWAVARAIHGDALAAP
jgi:iron complex transport system substrate-binding protein